MPKHVTSPETAPSPEEALTDVKVSFEEAGRIAVSYAEHSEPVEVRLRELTPREAAALEVGMQALSDARRDKRAKTKAVLQEAEDKMNEYRANK